MTPLDCFDVYGVVHVKCCFFLISFLQVLEQFRKWMLPFKKLCFSEVFCARVDSS